MPWEWWVLVLDSEESPSLRSFCECYQFWTDENLRVTVRMGKWKMEKFKLVLAHVPVSWVGEKLLVYTSKGWGQTWQNSENINLPLTLISCPSQSATQSPVCRRDAGRHPTLWGLTPSLPTGYWACRVLPRSTRDWGGLELYGMLSQHTSCLWFKKCCKTSWGAYD